MGYCYLSIALSSNKIDERKKFLESALDCFKNTIALNGSYLEHIMLAQYVIKSSEIKNQQLKILNFV